MLYEVKHMNNIKMLAFDLGASSGRAMLGIFDGNKIEIQEMHRFTNEPVLVHGHYYWDILRLFYEIKQGILKTINKGHGDIASIGVDTWGVDFGLLDESGNLLGNPYHYRDSRTDNMMEEVFKIIPKKELYKKTGIQFMKLNTIYQLFSMIRFNSSMLKQAKRLLFIPDLINYFLTGVEASEYTIASTTQLLDANMRDWDEDILAKLGISKDIFANVIEPGTIIGNLSTDIKDELNIGDVPVIAVGSHDTASAVASVPTLKDDYVYISCGTWSLMGVESEEPIINEKSYSSAFTNEGGVNNKIRFLKNIMGLWLIQECKRQWDKEGEKLGYDELENMAGQSEAFKSFIDPDCEMFIAPGNMPKRIQKYCENTNQPIPKTKGEIVRCIAESLAMKYRHTVENLEELMNKELPVIHMVGGGIKDKLLCQFTANATGRDVIAGPVEATAIGNLLMQAMALGKIKDLTKLRQTVIGSFPTKTYKPEECSAWQEAYNRFGKIINK
jgi:rhamnulokinase